MATQIEMVQNDTRPNFTGSVAFDLSGYTIKLHISFSTPLVKEGTILTAGASESTFEFVFGVGDLPHVGTYDWEIQFDDGSQGVTTYKKDSEGDTLKIKFLPEIA